MLFSVSDHLVSVNLLMVVLTEISNQISRASLKMLMLAFEDETLLMNIHLGCLCDSALSSIELFVIILLQL